MDQDVARHTIYKDLGILGEREILICIKGDEIINAVAYIGDGSLVAERILKLIKNTPDLEKEIVDEYYKLEAEKAYERSVGNYKDELYPDGPKDAA